MKNRQKTTYTRQATTKDIASINKLMKKSKAYWGYDAKFLDQFITQQGVTKKLLNKSVTQVFFIDATMVGFYTLIKIDDSCVELDNFFLDPDLIGKGYGRILWNACLAQARSTNSKKIILISDPHAEKFYLHMGCKKTGTVESPLTPGRNLPILEYNLSS